LSNNLAERIQKKILQQLVRRMMVRRRRHDDDLQRLGSRYGGWWVPSFALTPKAIVVSAGVGEDTTFDEELLRRGCRVVAMDPTPRARQHVEARLEGGFLGGSFEFLPVGLWEVDTHLKFYAPADPTHVSHSVVNIQGTSQWFEAEVWSLNRVIEASDLSHIDVLKMDIEGAEVAVLRHMLLSPIRPPTLCVELDAPLPVSRTLGLLRQLRRADYRLAAAEGWNLVFLHGTGGDAVHPSRLVGTFTRRKSG